MNILFLNTYPGWGGGETWMLDIFKGLSLKGHSCHLAGRKGSQWHERAAELGLSPITLNIRGEIAPLIMAQLRRIYRRKRIHLVLCNFDKEARIASLARIFGKRPIVVNMKGLPLLSDNWRYRFSYRHLFDHTVVCADFIKKEFAKHKFINENKISVINNCLNAKAASLPSEEFRRENGISPGTKIVGACARFDFRKGIQDLIAAAPVIKASYPDVRFAVVGNGLLRNALVRQVQLLNLSDSFIFVGFRRDLDAVFSAFDIFVLPSHHEGFPYVTQIAMHHSKPIVATAVNGVPEQVQDGVSGFLVEPGRPKQIAEKVLALLHNNELYESFGKMGNMILRERFSFDRMIDGFEELFERLIGPVMLSKS